MWLHAYKTSSDPRVIGGYFLQKTKTIGAVSTVVRADKGTENVLMGQMQRHFRRSGQDALRGEKSFMTGKSCHNQRIEYWWSFLRKECTEFWINLFHSLKDEGDYDGSFVDQNLSQFCFMGVIQVSFSKQK